MTDQDEEDLGRLLTDTFASRESLADPERARRIAAEARPARRRTSWLPYAATAAAAVLVIGVGAAVVTRGSSSPSADQPSASTSPTTSSPEAPAPTTDIFAMNKIAAASETARVARLVPLPDGAQQLTSRPDGLPMQPSSVGANDPSLTAITWWSVPVPVPVLRQYLKSHAPDGLANGDSDGYSSGPDQPTVYFASYTEKASPAAMAFLPVSLAVDYVAAGDHTLVQGSAYTEAYTAHPAEAVLDPTDVASVDIARVARSSPSQPNQPQPPVHLAAPADAASIGKLAAAINALPGSASPPFRASCPMMQAPLPSDAVTFTMDDGSTIAFHLTPFCFNQIDVTVAGRKLTATLDPGTLDNLLDQIDSEPAS